MTRGRRRLAKTPSCGAAGGKEVPTETFERAKEYLAFQTGRGLLWVVPHLSDQRLLSAVRQQIDKVFTNGTLISAKMAHRLAGLGNVFPAISVEGFEKHNLLRSCMIVDVPEVLREVVSQRAAHPTHAGAESVLQDLADRLNANAEEYQKVADRVREALHAARR